MINKVLSYKKLWTTISITLVFKKYNEEQKQAIWKWIEHILNYIDDTFSRFNENSVLSKLNKNNKYKVDEHFIYLIKKSKELNKHTDWYFNPLVNLKSIWYSKDFYKKDFKIEASDYSVDISNIKIDDENNVFLWENTNIDLWWIAKWYAVDLMAQFLDNFDLNGYIVNAWWDIVLKWFSENNETWVVWIENPFDKSLLWTLVWTDIAVVTSWYYKRNWEIEDKNYHHIINPKTKENEDSIISITLVWEKCHFVDWLATAICAMWFEKGFEFCKKEHIPAIIVLKTWKIVYTKEIDKYDFVLE